jgi:hypothetical protein
MVAQPVRPESGHPGVPGGVPGCHLDRARSQRVGGSGKAQEQRAFAGQGRWPAVAQVGRHCLADVRGQRQALMAVCLAPDHDLAVMPVSAIQPQRGDLPAGGGRGPAGGQCARRRPGRAMSRSSLAASPKRE